MPVLSIKGPSGLSKSSKKELIEGALRTLEETYPMPDARVYIQEVPAENVGHTPILEVTKSDSWAVQTEPPRIYVEIVAPPGLPIEAKRKLVRELTQIAGRAYGRSNLRDVLVSLDEHPVENFASNGFLQTENPDMAPFADVLKRK
jgi:phenylpyruvate tautomerase PptA (4-oxalocrotonate tautomerase family)